MVEVVLRWRIIADLGWLPLLLRRLIVLVLSLHHAAREIFIGLILNSCLTSQNGIHIILVLSQSALHSLDPLIRILGRLG